jgi:hypothetical protein
MAMKSPLNGSARMAFGLTSIAFPDMPQKHAKLWLPLFQALVDGKVVERIDPNGLWYPVGGASGYVLDTTENVDLYRIKPEPTRVPLGPEDIEPWSVIRKVSDLDRWWLVCSVKKESIGTDGNEIGWHGLMEHYEIKRPGQDGWQPCWKEV